MGGLNPPRLHRGEIWWADAPDGKTRPVLVLTRDRFIPKLNDVLVAPVTSVVRGIPTEVYLTTDDGMPRNCAVNFDNMASIRVNRFRERITQLNDARMNEVCRAYRFAAGC